MFKKRKKGFFYYLVIAFFEFQWYTLNRKDSYNLFSGYIR